MRTCNMHICQHFDARLFFRSQEQFEFTNPSSLGGILDNWGNAFESYCRFVAKFWGEGGASGARQDPPEVIHFKPRWSCRERHLNLQFDFLQMIKNIDFIGEEQLLITQFSLLRSNKYRNK